MAKRSRKRAPVKQETGVVCCLGKQNTLCFAIIVAVIGLWFTVRDLGYLGGPTSNLLMWPLLVFVSGVALWVHYSQY